MLSLGALGGCDGGTDNLKASEIKALLVPFFGLDRVNRCNSVLCGENEIVVAPGSAVKKPELENELDR